MPLDDLSVGVVVTGTALGQVVGVHEATERVTTLLRLSTRADRVLRERTYEISTVGVKLSSEVIRLEVQHGLVNEGKDLEVRGGAKELNALDGTGRDEAGTTAGLGAPSNLLALSIGDGLVGLGRRPKTPVFQWALARRQSATLHKRVPSIWFTNAVWQSESWPSVVELQRL